MGGLSLLRDLSRVFACLSVGLGWEGEATEGGKIKAASCGSVGWQKSGDRSVTWRKFHFRTAPCPFAQPIGKQ